MPRRPRADAPGAWHHVMNRGGRRRDIFTRDAHCVLFLELLGEVTEKLGWEVHAWALMPNHFHLLVRSVEGNLTECMHRLCGRYTRRINAAEGWDGPMFRARYRSQRVMDARYLRHLVAYLHMNPVRSRLVRRADEAPWTSHRAHLGLDSAPAWLATWMVEEQFGSPEQLQACVRDLHTGRERWPAELDLETGWLRLPDAAKQRFARPLPHGEPPPAPLDAERVLDRVCQITGAARARLRERVMGRGANPPRRFAVWMLAERTTLTRPQVAQLLQMPARQVEAVLYRIRKRGPGEPLATWAQQFAASSEPPDQAGDVA